MGKTTLFYPWPAVDGAGKSLVSHAGAGLLTALVGRVGFDRAISTALRPWAPRHGLHDPGKVLTDLAVSLAVGGDCLADVAVLRNQDHMFGLVASDPTVSRVVDRLAADADSALRALDAVSAAVRQRVWKLAGSNSPGHGRSAADPLIIDVDATLVTAHSDKERAAATFKRGFGFHPLVAFVDHGADGTGEPVAAMLRPGNAGSNTAADHITVIRQALQQLSRPTRPGRSVLIRTDAAGCTHQVVAWLTRRRLQYSLGFSLTDAHATAIRAMPETAWTPAYDDNGVQRDGAWVTDATGVLDLSGWPPGMRVIVRAERPHPGAQLRFTDLDGNRLTALATNTTSGQHAALELRHRRRARCEDRIRAAKDTGLQNLPLHDFDQNRIWQAVVMLAMNLTAWLQLLAFTGDEARTWEPKRLRLRIFSIAGSIARHARKVRLHLSDSAPFTDLALTGLARIAPT